MRERYFGAAVFLFAAYELQNCDAWREEALILCYRLLDFYCYRRRGRFSFNAAEFH